MKKVLLLVLMLFVFNIVYAETFTIKAKLQDSGDVFKENLEEFQDEGWRKANEDEDEYGYIYEKEETVEKLPWGVSVGYYNVSISKDGEVSIDYSAGDADYVASTSIKLPKKDKKFVIPDEPYVLELNAGDQTGGWWNMNGKIEISIKP